MALKRDQRENREHPKAGRIWQVGLLLSVLLLAGGYWWLSRHGSTATAVVAPPPEPADATALDPELRAEITRLLALIRTSPNTSELRSELGKVYQANGLPRLAAATYEQAIALGGNKAELWYLTALAQERSGSLEDAVNSLALAMAEPDAPEAAAWRRGQWLTELGRFDEAEQVLTSAIEQQPSNEAAWFALAELHVTRREAQQAVRILEDRNLLEGVNAEPAYALLARAYRQLGMLENSAAAAARSSSATPTWPDPASTHLARYLHGVQKRQLTVSHLIQQERYEQAIPLLKQLLNDEPNDRRVLNLLGTSYLRLGRVQEAIAVLRIAVKEHPRHFSSNLNLASTLWREKPTDVQQLREALEYVNTAVSLRPASGMAHELRGAILAALQEYEPAIESLLQAYEQDTRNIDPLLNAADLQYNLRRWADAEQSFRRALAAQPSSGRARLGMIACLIEQLRHDEANLALSEVERVLGTDNPLVQALRRRHAELLVPHVGTQR